MGNILALKLVMIHSQNEKITVINTSDYKHRFMLLLSFMVQGESCESAFRVNLSCDFQANVIRVFF